MPLERLMALAFAAFAFAPLAAQDARGEDDPAARAFVEQVVAAINRDDTAARRALMHPDALKCDEASKQAMAEGAFRPTRGPIPAGYGWQILPMPAGTAGWFAEKFDYPVRPTHQLQIDYDTEPRHSEAVLLQLVHEGGAWREVTGCPKAATLNEARQAAKARGEQQARIQRLAATIAPQLEAEVLHHATEGRKIDAILHYRKATNEDLAIAKGVVEQLMQEAEGPEAGR